MGEKVVFDFFGRYFFVGLVDMVVGFVLYY